MTSSRASAPGPGLHDIQGNILKGHGLRHTRLLFFRLGTDVRKNRRMLRDAANGREEIGLTSAARQALQTAKWRELAPLRQSDPARFLAEANAPFRSLGLTAAGLKACGFPDAQSVGIENALAEDIFWDGTAQPKRGLHYGDEAWHPAFEGEPHGMFLLAHDVEPECRKLAETCAAVLQSPAYGVTETWAEAGQRWIPHDDGITYEPFGFADGFARTRIIADRDSPLAGVVQASGAGAISSDVRPFEIPVQQVMISARGPWLGGSLLVLRKLEQNVQAFLTAEQTLQNQLDALPGSRRPKGGTAGGYLIGRERDGRPVVAPRQGRLADRFHFGGDPAGSRCPFHAHIRKMNPRQIFSRIGGHPLADRRVQKQAQFVRRGVVFGPDDKLRTSWANPADAPTGGVGLLFMGYMSSILGQFMQMHLAWAPAQDFPKTPSGPDPLFAPAGALWKWLRPRSRTELAVPLPQPVVSGRGAAYLIVPPLTFLRNLP